MMAVAIYEIDSAELVLKKQMLGYLTGKKFRLE